MLYLNWNFNHFNLIIKHGHIITSFASDESFNLNHMVLHMDNPTKSTSNSHSKHHTIHAIILPWHNQIEARIKLGSRGSKVVSFDLERRRSGRRNIRKKKKNMIRFELTLSFWVAENWACSSESLLVVKIFVGKLKQFTKFIFLKLQFGYFFLHFFRYFLPITSFFTRIMDVSHLKTHVNPIYLV